MRRSAALSVAIMLPCAAGSSVYAQAFNIDLDSPTSPPALGGGVPSASYGAASGQAGFWNSYTGFAGVTPLAGLNGALTGATISSTGGSVNLLAFNNGANSGDYALLMNDALQIGTLLQGGVRTFTFSGLANGQYTLYTYAAPPQGTPGLTMIEVLGSTTPNPQTAFGPASGNVFAEGATHTIHDVLVTDGTITVIAIAQGGQGVAGYISGFQLVVPSPGAAALLALGGLAGARRRR